MVQICCRQLIRLAFESTPSGESRRLTYGGADKAAKYMMTSWVQCSTFWMISICTLEKGEWPAKGRKKQGRKNTLGKGKHTLTWTSTFEKGTYNFYKKKPLRKGRQTTLGKGKHTLTWQSDLWERDDQQNTFEKGYRALIRFTCMFLKRPF